MISEESKQAKILTFKENHSREQEGVITIESQYRKDIGKLFENSYSLIPIAEVASKLGRSKKTLYNWHYGQQTRRDIPGQLIHKINGRLHVSKEVLIEWLTSMDKVS